MTRSQKNIYLAYTLAGLFTLFNVGLPIVTYVCPMMSGGKSTCDCRVPVSKQIAFTYQRGDCCGTRVLAERNTNPFLSVAKYQTPCSEVVLVFSANTMHAATCPQMYPLAFSADTGPPVPAEPLYLLSSSLLI